MDEKEIRNGQLARELFLCCSGRFKNLTLEERGDLESFFQEGDTESFLNLGSGKIIIDPVLFNRVKKAVAKYGDIVIDIVNDIIFGFPEDGLNDYLADERKDSLFKDFIKEGGE